jgi:RimJ/RimL family protein N-acetyltransferase
VEPGVPGEWFQIALSARDGGALVGDLALHVSGDDPRLAEIGFTLDPSYQGQGYATEALRGYLDWLFPTFGLHRVHAVTDPLNEPAAALLSRVGFRREAHLVENVWFKGAWGSEHVYAVLEREWRELSRGHSSRSADSQS